MRARLLLFFVVMILGVPAAASAAAPKNVVSQHGPDSKAPTAVALGALVSGAHAQTTPPIETELVIQTPVSQFITDAVFKEFVRYAREKWNFTLKVTALRAGTPVSYDRIVKWKGKPEADMFWGGETALFDQLAAQKLLVQLDTPSALWDPIPASIGTPKSVPLKDPQRFWVGTAL
ncbi:MAG TPA: hypothetical protein VNT02_12890, partial [Burkholderiales bacterium]|nr:hypothetical protein [Burkholderiales bacterium]